MPRDAFVLKIQRELCHPKYARKVSGLSRNRPQFRNHLKSLPVIGHKKYFCAQSESSSFRVTFVTSYSSVFSANFFLACSPFIYLLMQESFPRSKSAIETRTMKPKKKNSKFSMFVNQPEKASTEKLRLWTNRR